MQEAFAMHQPGRRILALVLPNLLCELVEAPLRATQAVERQKEARLEGRAARGAGVAKERSSALHVPPLGVVLKDTEQEGSDPSIISSDVLSAVNVTAARYGVRAGQSIAEASVLLTNLRIYSLVRSRVGQALGQIAEVALKFGTVSAIEPPIAIEGVKSKHAGEPEQPIPDTVWLDITGVAHLYGGEEALATELASLVRGMGHIVRIAIADGPLTAQALAHWGEANSKSKDSQGIIVAPAQRAKPLLLALPIVALPVTKEQAAWLFRCGVRKVGDLENLPKDAVTARLEESAVRVLDFLEGHDEIPLRAYRVPHLPFEELSFDEGIVGSEPLLFVLRGLIARLSTRLEARGQAARELSITFTLDGSIAKLRGHNPREVIVFSLPSPVFREEELNRIVTTRVRRLQLGAPVRAIRIEATQVTRSEKLQLGFSRLLTGASGDRSQGPESLPVLLAELAADIGKKSFGVLEQVSSHLPEKKSSLVAAESAINLSSGLEKRRAKVVQQRPKPPVPCRFFNRAVPFKATLQVGETIVIEQQMFMLKEAHFERRLDHVEWWQGSGVSRDYWRLWLTSPIGDLEALIFVDRKSGGSFLQAIYD